MTKMAIGLSVSRNIVYMGILVFYFARLCERSSSDQAIKQPGQNNLNHHEAFMSINEQLPGWASSRTVFSKKREGPWYYTLSSSVFYSNNSKK